MKKNHLSRVPLFSAIIAGVVAWSIHPSLFELVAAPIRQSFVDQMPTEILFYRLKTAAAFTALGALVPIAAIFVSRNKTERNYGRSLCFLTTVVILVASATTWFMYARIATFSVWFSELLAKDPSIPNVASYSIIPLHRIAIYPSLLMLMIIAIMFVRTYNSRTETKQEGQQVAS